MYNRRPLLRTEVTHENRYPEAALRLGLLGRSSLVGHPSPVFESIPDGPLLERLRTCVATVAMIIPWPCSVRVIVLTIALRHRDFEACLGELRRNPTLQQLIGIESVKQIPRGDNVSRFLEALGQDPHRSRLQDVFNVMSQRLGRAVPYSGVDTAGDSTSVQMCVDCEAMPPPRRLLRRKPPRRKPLRRKRGESAAEKAAAEKAEVTAKAAAAKTAAQKTAAQKTAVQKMAVAQAAASARGRANRVERTLPRRRKRRSSWMNMVCRSPAAGARNTPTIKAR